jgi:hypothetical protein
LGVDFVIWRRESAWFWFLINPRGNGGMIGDGKRGSSDP